MSNNCNYDGVNNNYRCRSCGNVECKECVEEIRQRRIWNTVRVPSSLYMMNLSALNVVGGVNNKPKAEYGNVNWNQMSDRAVPSVPISYVPTRGNSLKSSLTSNRPGGSAAGGIGVDVKHDSYARYLARKKGKNIKTNKTKIDTPKYGNKQFPYGIVRGCNLVPTPINIFIPS